MSNRKFRRNKMYQQVTVSESKHLSNVPTKWSYDEENKKVYMLFEQYGCRYLLIERALIGVNIGSFTTAVLGDGREFILFNNSERRLATA